jgi:hypothetical protein
MAMQTMLGRAGFLAGVTWVGAGLVVAAGLMGACASGQMNAQPAERAQTEAPTSVTPEADELLTRLEHAGEGITDLTADINYDKTFPLQGDEQRRIGKLYFRSEPPQTDGKPGRRAFAVTFTKMYVGDRVEDDPVTYIFDGQWLLVKYAKAKRYEKRQVARPGDNFDPLRIGEGPFPMPIGQKKGDIVSRYQVAMEPTEGGLDPATPPGPSLIKFALNNGGSFQLHLVPLPDRSSDNLKDIRLWYNKADLLPRMARTENGAGEVSIVQLLNVRTDVKVPEKELDTTTPGAGWDGQTSEWREPVADGARSAMEPGIRQAGPGVEEKKR